MAASTTTPTPPIVPTRTVPTTPAALGPLIGATSDAGAGRHETLRVRDWRVVGASKVVGDADVGFADLRGNVTVGGAFRAADVRSRGQLSVNGITVVEGPLRANGYSEFSGAVRAERLETSGFFGVTADLAVTGTAAVTGRAEVAGSLSAGTLHLSGSVAVRGAVTVDRLEGELRGASKTGPIRANSIELRAVRFPPWRAPGSLTTLRIEAHEVRLEGATVEFLRADRISLGPHCRVARVEGRIVERHRSSYVGPFARGWIAPGLSR
jgi:cytoskeletal protein CcmA (bactofilin family)